MKKTSLFIFLLTLNIQSFAGFKNDIAFGAQIGEGITGYKSSRIGVKSSDIRRYNIAARVYADYQITEQLHTELGYFWFKDTRVENINKTGSDGTISQSAIDLLFRGEYAFGQHYSAVGRFGLAYVTAKPSDEVRAVSDNDYADSEVRHFRPVMGLGIAYQFNSNWQLGASWLHILHHRAIPSSDFIGFDLSFHPWAK